jgi:hypothetical protein
MQKPVFKWAWQKIETGDYTNIKDFKIAMREYTKWLKKNQPKEKTPKAN